MQPPPPGYYYNNSGYVGFWFWLLIFGFIVVFCAIAFCFGSHHLHRSGTYTQYDADGNRVGYTRFHENDTYVDDEYYPHAHAHTHTPVAQTQLDFDI